MKKYLLLVLLLLPFQTHAAWKWIGGAELNSVTDGVEVTTNSAPIATTTTAHSGSYAWEAKNGAGFQRQVIYTSNQATVGIIRVWVYVKAYPNAATQFIRFSNASNVSQGNITMNTDGTLSLLKVSGAQVGSNSSAVPLNTWTYIELKDDASGVGALEGRLNGSVFATGANSAQGTWARVLWGNITGTQTSNDVLFDDIAVTDVGTGYPGSTSEAFIQPSGDGDAHQWLQTAGGAGSATNYTLVNEIPPNDATSFVNTVTLNNQDLYLMGAGGTHSYDTINALTINVRYANGTADATTAFKVEYETSASGNKGQSAAIIPNSTTWTSYGVQAAKADSANFATTTGATGAALTSADLSNGQMGYILSAAGTNKAEVTNIWAYADYTPGTAPVVSGAVIFPSIYGWF